MRPGGSNAASAERKVVRSLTNKYGKMFKRGQATRPAQPPAESAIANSSPSGGTSHDETSSDQANGVLAVEAPPDVAPDDEIPF